MKSTPKSFLFLQAFVLIPALLLSGCARKHEEETATEYEAGAETTMTTAAPESAPLAGGVAIPSEVRKNLGIGFATVERRRVRDTLRAPGSFELLPGARQEYRAPLNGRLHILVQQFDAVEAGTVLFTLDSPDWRRLQHEVVEAEGEITLARAGLRVAQAKLEETQRAVEAAGRRVEALAAVAMRKADLEAEAASLRNSLPRLRAEIEAAKAELAESEEHYESRLRTLAPLAGLSLETLRAPDDQGEATWRALSVLEIRAKQAGVVDSVALNQGAWLDTGDLVLVALDPAALRFRAEVPHADLLQLREGVQATIVPPLGGGITLQQAMQGPLQLALTVQPRERTISVYILPEILAPWARAGVSGYVEIPREESPLELAIPTEALVQEGVDTIFFRRSPRDPNRAIPVKADLGASDGRWVVVRSGVREGDEVVVDGAYALKLAGGGSQPPGGYHYHADGQFHKNH